MILRSFILVLVLTLFNSCKNYPKNLSLSRATSNPESYFYDFKVEDSNFINLDSLWTTQIDYLNNFSIDRYLELKPLILNKDIPTMQQHVSDGKMSYEDLALFYLYRIKILDRLNKKSLNSIISINPKLINEAKLKDKNRPKEMSVFSLYGMPIILKDNINTKGMPTTAGSVALLNNFTDDAFVTKKIKSSGALILGKANMSEWAYFFCGDCPSGYSAVGGQTFNPYHKKVFDTGGSSSGSAVAVSASFCAAAVGTETSGSILSPSSQASTVGLKPTVGTISRSGIIPISSTLDTPGPITRFTIDNLLLYNEMLGKDTNDIKSVNADKIKIEEIINFTFKKKRFGVIRELMTDSLYEKAIDLISDNYAEIIMISPRDIKLNGFLKLLNIDMKADLKLYFNKHSPKTSFDGVQSIIDFNNLDSLKRAPYGQRLFNGIISDEVSKEEFESVKTTLKNNGREYFDYFFNALQLDAILSINNYHASYAAVAEYPALTIPMGFSKIGEPKGLTFISKPFTENELYKFGYYFEKIANKRIAPENYN